MKGGVGTGTNLPRNQRNFHEDEPSEVSTPWIFEDFLSYKNDYIQYV
jgi:hypothetical protein